MSTIAAGSQSVQLLPVGIGQLGLRRGTFRSFRRGYTQLFPNTIRSLAPGHPRTHGSHENTKPFSVIAREAPQGSNSSVSTSQTASNTEIIVLGFDCDGQVTATPVGGANGAPTSSESARCTESSSAAGAASSVPSSALHTEPQSYFAGCSDSPAASLPPVSGSSIASSSPPISTTASPPATNNTTVTSAPGAIGNASPRTSNATFSRSSSTAAPPTFPAADTASAAPALPLAPPPSPSPQPHHLHQLHGPDQVQQPFPLQQLQQQDQPQPGLRQRLVGALHSFPWTKAWALALLSISYVHQATTGFALPAMLPQISNELHLTDLQGALLTTGYSYLYALALVPIGLLADRVSRPRLLAAGLGLWSLLTITASSCRSFSELLLARVGFAAAQGAQNPVCFSLIPELFPVNKSTALSVYNCAIYVGRALSFAAVLLARHLHDNDQAHLTARGGLRVDTRLNHLDRADLHSLAIMHTTGDMAAAAPDHEFIFPLGEYGNELPDAAWRQVLRWIAVPGFCIGLIMMATLGEPRQQQAEAVAAPAVAATSQQVELTRSKGAAAISLQAAVAAAPAAAPALVAQQEDPHQRGLSSTGSAGSSTTSSNGKEEENAEETTTAATPQKQQPAQGKEAQEGGGSGSSSSEGIWALLRSPGFMSVTLAAALNDVGSYALIAWQSTFYERVYGIESCSYAPVLAVLLPIGGILGGVGGGYLADRLSRSGRRWWVTAGATLAAAPCLAASCLAPSPEASYGALLVGFALSEMWRAPSAVMARGIAPPSMGSTASALYLCVRNLLGGLGPLAVAGLAGVVGLQAAMMVVPAMYLASGLVFGKAEKLYGDEMQAKAKASLAAA